MGSKIQTVRNFVERAPHSIVVRRMIYVCLLTLSTYFNCPDLAAADKVEEKIADNVSTLEFEKNDWFEKFIFRSLKSNNSRTIESVVIFVGGYLDPKKVLSDKQWRDFGAENNLGLVSLEFSYFSKRLDQNGKDLPLLHKKDPEKALDLLSNQLFKLTKKAYPRAKNIVIVGGDLAIEISILENKNVVSWITRNSDKRIPDEPRKLPYGLNVCDSDRRFTQILESHEYNQANRKKITLLNVDENKKDGLIAFIHEYILESFRDSETKGKYVSLVSEESQRTFRGEDERRECTWLPSDEIMAQWKVLHSMDKKDKLEEIHKVTVGTGVKEQPELNLYMKMPRTIPRGEAPRGVLCIVTWQAAESSMMNILLHKTFKGELVDWAEKNKFAVVTWNTVTLWNTGVSQSELERDQARFMDHRFDQVSRAWRIGMNQLAKRYGLPEDDYFIYGISRGAHWGHRLVLRNPSWFQAAHFHVANSYDVPSESAKNLLWMITTGENDLGYKASFDFYKTCQKLGYPIVIKAGQGLGHGDSDEIRKLSICYFDYALALKNEAREKHAPISLLMHRDLRKAQYVGDFINHGVYKMADASWIPREQKIRLPSLPFGKVWGNVEQ